jgi:5S rRNA maturation endonuclease (ribonuclease M5)
MDRIDLSEAEIRSYYQIRIPKWKKSGKELRGPCPIHRGTRDSLAINLETGAWFCHSGCARGGSIFDFEAEVSCTNGETARAAVLAAVGRSKPDRRIIATYDYHDENGTLLYQVVRYLPKDFHQRRPDRRGDWIWNLKGVRKVLYHLPAVIAAKIVFIAEGEKDVDALVELGVTATCNVGGAGKWKAEYTQFLRGKDVIVLPDHDVAGREHAARVMQSLTDVAASVKLIQLPAAKDAAEWIANGGTLDALVALVEREEAGSETSQGSLLSGAELLAEIDKYIRRYLVLPEPSYLPLALWALATHAVQIFDCFPYIAALSAAKRSGKTRLAEVLQMLVRRPWRGTAPSPAALYRMLEGAPTLLLDEIEVLSRRNASETTQILIAVLNAGHRKGATIPRCEPPKFDVRYFDVYGPKMFAAIGRLPDTLADRSIIIRMKRRSKSQKVGRFREARAQAEGKPIHDGAARFVETHTADIERAYQKVLEADLDYLNDRDADVWTPLFAICTATMPERLDDLKKCALVLSAAKAGDDADDSLPTTLLRDIRSVWPDNRENCSTVMLLDKLSALADSPWVEPEHKLTPRKLAGMLRPYEVRPLTVRVDDAETHTPKGYRYADFQDAFDRYLEEKSATSATNQ